MVKTKLKDNIAAVGYRLGTKISSGAYGDVYNATRDKKKYTVKRFRDTKFEKKWGIESPIEIDILSRFRHDHILRSVDIFFIDNSNTCIVTPYAGTDLISNFDLPYEKKRIVFFQVLSALEYLHSRGILHLDIKPQNVLVDAQGDAKLIDFGISAIMDSEGYSCNATERITLTYKPPEALVEEDVIVKYDRQSDFWSLGITVYEFFYGDSISSNDCDNVEEMKEWYEDRSDWEEYIRERIDDPRVEDVIVRLLTREGDRTVTTLHPYFDGLDRRSYNDIVGTRNRDISREDAEHIEKACRELKEDCTRGMIMLAFSLHSRYEDDRDFAVKMAAKIYDTHFHPDFDKSDVVKEKLLIGKCKGVLCDVPFLEIERSDVTDAYDLYRSTCLVSL